MAQTDETAFETYVVQMLLAKGWQQGTAADWDKDRALFPRLITEFIATTQPDLWAAMRGQHGAQLERLLVDALVKELAIKGSLPPCAAPRLQVLRQDLPPGHLQTCARPQ